MKKHGAVLLVVRWIEKVKHVAHFPLRKRSLLFLVLTGTGCTWLIMGFLCFPYLFTVSFFSFFHTFSTTHSPPPRHYRPHPTFPRTVECHVGRVSWFWGFAAQEIIDRCIATRTPRRTNEISVVGVSRRASVSKERVRVVVVYCVGWLCTVCGGCLYTQRSKSGHA